MREPFKEGEFGEPEGKKRGYYTKIAWKYIKKLIDGVKSGKCPTKMLKASTNPEIVTKKDKTALYNATWRIKRDNRDLPIDINKIDGDIWYTYKGSDSQVDELLKKFFG